MIVKRPLVSLLFFAAALGCGDKPQIVGPVVAPVVTQAEVHPRMDPVGFLSTVVLLDEPAPSPAVRIYDSKSLKPLPGIAVSFKVHGGELSISSAVTDRDGIARSDGWRPDFAQADPSVTATADGVSTQLKFTVSVVNKKVVAEYRLDKIAGQSLPVTYGLVGAGAVTWAITGGAYRLFDDGTYVRGYEVDHVQGWGYPLRYERTPTGFEFYLSQSSAPLSSFYADRGYLFSRGTLNGNTMMVKYEDFIDFEDEVYVAKQ